MTQTDILIIGAGPGGYRAAAYAAQNGQKVVIVERDEVGGTCLNRGCIPTKTYVHAATFAEAFAAQPQVVTQLRSGIEQLMAHPNITLLRGQASFVSPSEVQVGDDTYTASAIIIATGSATKYLPLPDIDDARLVDSTGLLQLSEQPRRLAIIGAGVIGMEFASVFNRFGSEVTVIEYLKECLPVLDSDIAKRLRKLLEKKGIKFQMKTAVQQLKDIDADVILMATGRKPNTEGLNVEAAGIALNPNGTIPVDDHFQVATQASPRIYAIGDVNGRQMLAHAAEMQGIHVVNQIIGREDHIRFDVMPAAIFTTPEAACVGLSEDQLKRRGLRVSQGLPPCQRQGPDHARDRGHAEAVQRARCRPHLRLSRLWCPCCRYGAGGQRIDVPGRHCCPAARYGPHPSDAQRDTLGCRRSIEADNRIE